MSPARRSRNDIPELDDHDHTHEEGVAVLVDLKPGQVQCVQRSDYRTVKIRVDEKDVNATRKWERQRGFLLGMAVGFVATLLSFMIMRWIG